MSSEDLIACCAMGFIFGIFLFAAVLIRVRRWPLRDGRGRSEADASRDVARYKAGSRTLPAPLSLKGLCEHFFIVDRVADLVISLFILAMLLYGAVVVPRLRVIMAVAGVTALGCWWCWRTISKWWGRRARARLPSDPS